MTLLYIHVRCEGMVHIQQYCLTTIVVNHTQLSSGSVAEDTHGHVTISLWPPEFSFNKIMIESILHDAWTEPGPQ
jgi:hypothetical protein